MEGPRRGFGESAVRGLVVPTEDYERRPSEPRAGNRFWSADEITDRRVDAPLLYFTLLIRYDMEGDRFIEAVLKKESLWRPQWQFGHFNRHWRLNIANI